MSGALGPIISLAVGAVLAAVTAFALPGVINGSPQAVTEPLVSYGTS